MFPSPHAARTMRAPSAHPPSALRILWPGLLGAAALAAASIALGGVSWLQSHGLSALTLAIVLGMLTGNTVYGRFAASWSAGVVFSRQTLLRAGVVLYGLRLTLGDVARVGSTGVAIDLLVLASTFALAVVAGTRLFGLDRKTALLIGAGSSICGAAAVMATEPVIKARAEQVTVAVATVVVFGTLAILLYPLLYRLNEHWPWIPGGASGFGIYAGSTIHEVAQVVAAARSIGSQTADAAVIEKLVRVMMLAPVLVALSAWRARGRAGPGADGVPHRGRITIPWFAFGFIAVVAFNSLHWLPERAVALATDFDTVLLAMAMAALGLSTHFSAIRKAGLKPLLLACLLFAWLVVGGALINHAVPALLAAGDNPA